MQENQSATPLISVIIPIYNVEEYLEACLESLEQQTFRDIEVLMIDDGSPDKSFEICRAFEARDPRFHYFRKENGGAGDARNYGIAKSKAPFMSFIDPDDLIEKELYEHMYSRITLDESDFAACSVIRFNSSKQWASPIHARAFFNTPSTTNIHESNQLVYDTITCNKLIRRSFWDENGFSFPAGMLYEDIPVAVPMYYLAKKVSVLQECGYLWRARDGAITSVTQNVANPNSPNLRDRLAAMRTVDRLFEKTGAEESLMLLKSVKYLEIDLYVFVNACAQLEEDQALRTFDGIIEFIRESIDPAAFKLLSPINQQRYRYVLNRDYQGLKKLIEFAPAYKKLEVHDTGDDLTINPPENIFSIESRSIKREIELAEPTVSIDDAEVGTDSCTLKCSLFKPRVNVAEDQLRVEASLVSDLTCASIPLSVTPAHDTRLTEARSLVFDETTGEEVRYCYDGACFDIVLDFQEIAKAEGLAGGSRIVLEYSSRFYQGKAVLRGVSGDVRSKLVGKTFLAENSLVAFSKDFVSTLLVSMNNQAALCDIDFNNDEIVIESEARSAFAQDNEGNRIVLTNTDGSFRIDPCALRNERQYKLYAMEENGNASPLYLRKRGVRIVATGDVHCLILSTMDYSLRLQRLDSFSLLTKVEKDGAVIKMELQHCSAGDNGEIQKLQILSEGKIECALVPLCVAKKIAEGTFAARINFSNPATAKNLYASNRGLFARLTFADGTQRVERVYSEKYFKKTYTEETFKATIYRSGEGHARIISALKWGFSQNTAEKRKKIVRDEYPEMMKQPLNPQMILFESSLGASYSGNPRALYEYIQNEHPDHECVWSFNDPKTPIAGNARRVRRQSREYYECLAQAKYLITDDRLPDAFEKRDGQVELQTMNGTPMKTIGLEFAQETASDAARQRIVADSSRWDYLIAQGEFTKSKASDCFGYTGRVVETGYPRTDRLMTATASEAKAIKEALGIPSDKKTVLYAPTWRTKNRFDMRLDLEKLQKALGDDYVVLIRLHRLAAVKDAVTVDNEFSFDVTNYHSVEDLCIAADVLITDYSSIAFDYALTGKPMVFFPYDLQEYRDTLRGLYIDLEKEAPGPIAYTTEQVAEAVLRGRIDSDKAKAFQEKYLTYECEESTRRVVKQLFHPRRAFFDNMVRKLKK